MLIATGSRPRVLDFFEPDGERVLVGHQLYELDEVPEKLVVVGSGATRRPSSRTRSCAPRCGGRARVPRATLILPTEDQDAAALLERTSSSGRGMTILRNSRADACERTDAAACASG